ncbi:MAG: LapA family protein [Deltaproteobacteria bacterium]|nr:LapA family protein [Deltaproteobacteria bacterium]
MRWRLIIVLVLALIVLGLVSLFAVQNGARTTQLSLDLGFAAWQLGEPISITVLLGIALGIGLLVGVVLFVPRMLRLGRQVRSLERQASLGGDVSDEWK